MKDGVEQGACETAAECAPDFACWRGECRNSCTGDDECDEGSRCIRSSTQSACEPLELSSCDDPRFPPCPEGTDCDATRTLAACFTICEADADCPSGQRCDMPSAASTATHRLCRSEDPSRSPRSQASDAGTTGRVDAGGAPLPVRELGEACGEQYELACGGQASKIKLICDGTWQRNGTCDDGQLCNQATGGCADVVEACAARKPDAAFCDGDELQRCGRDLVTVDSIPCDLRCVETEVGAQCAAAGCGDSEVTAPEECDDGNTDNGDACTSLCMKAQCGDGFVWRDEEECDDADGDDGDDCLSSCERARCGDDELWVGVEDCDDGNTEDGDGCNADCRREGCGNDTLEPGELCEDGNLNDGDGCSSRCLPEPTQLRAGQSFTCAAFASGELKCWGENNRGQLGLGDTSPRGDQASELGAALPVIPLGTGRTLTGISAGDFHACALLDDNAIKCWGFNQYGQLGLGNSANRGDAEGEMGDALPAVDLGSGLTVRDVEAGSSWSCAVFDDGRLKCWGYGLEGQLGQGDTRHRGDGALEMGDRLPFVDLGSGGGVKTISAGWGHTCAVLDDGSIKCWGLNFFGQLGLGDTDNRGVGAGQMGDALPAVSLGSGRSATQVVANSWHTCALLDDGSVKCWGHGGLGQLGSGDDASRGALPGQMGNAMPPVDLGGGVVVALASGWDHTCARFESGQVKCWGDNSQGQLGLGDLQPRGDDTREMGSALPFVDLGTGRRAVEIDAGAYHTCARLDDGNIKCWGLNNLGQLGVGDDERRGHRPGDMGDALPAVPLW